MITISATQFHNKIGYYLGLLSEGKKVRLVKEKPQKEVMILVAENIEKEKVESPKKAALEFIKKNQYESPNWKNGLELQNYVRE